MRQKSRAPEGRYGTGPSDAPKGRMDPEIRAAIPHMIVTVLGQQAGRFEFTPPGPESSVQTADAVVLWDGLKDPPKSKAPLLRRVMAHIAPTKSTEATQ